MPEVQKADPMTRLAQVFAAKLVLEVFGGGGAIWGWSEVVTFRNPDTVWFWRPCAATFGAIFFIRFLLQIKDFINQYVLLSSNNDQVNMVRFVQIFSAKLVLEVFGGGGAIWGFSEAMTFRNPETQEFWRFWSAVAGGVFFVRFLLQCKDYLEKAEDDGRKPWLRLVQIFSAKLVLEVFGGAGAVWGFSEVLTLRRPETLWFWRPCALIFGAIFFCRWLLQVVDYVVEVKGHDSFVEMAQDKVIRLYQTFSARLVLEVAGGAGAIWGFSEVLTLRNAETVWFWRPVALTFGAIFFVRWQLQILDYVLEAKYHDSKASLNTKNFVRLLQIFSARLVLEVFGGGGAVWGFSEALTLRNAATVWFWRPAAIFFACIFFYRWMLQIKDYILEMKDMRVTKDLNMVDEISELKLQVEYGTTGIMA